MASPYEEGDPSSKILILGEAPANTEMRLGRPLVGPSGQLLEQCMHSAQMIRRECYILNVWETPVYKDKADKVIKDQNGEILWTAKDQFTELGMETSQNTRERISEASANVVIPLGGTALSWSYEDSRIMKWRGSILQGNEQTSGKKLVPTVHPAACLRGQYLWRYLLISDLERAKAESMEKSLNLPERTLLIDPTYQDVLAYLKSISASTKAVGFDIEVLNHQVSCLSFATAPEMCMSIPFVINRGEHRWSLEEEEVIWILIAEILGNPSIAVIGQNLIFDISFLLQQMGIHTRGFIGDTMIAHHIMYPDFLKGLDFLCSMHTREPYYKDDGKLWSKPWNDLELFWKYNARDSVVCMDMWPVFVDLMKKDGYYQDYLNTIEMFPMLLYMMMRGMCVDRERLNKTNDDVGRKISELNRALEDAADYPFNPASPKQCQEYFYEHKGIKPYISRSTGRPTTDDKAMSRIYRRFHFKEAKLVQEIRSLTKLQGTYLEVGIDNDDRIRCSYNPRGTNTSRLSSSQTIFGRGMNMQNLHADFKGFLVADHG
jgi:uracil-DNA glycosylase